EHKKGQVTKAAKREAARRGRITTVLAARKGKGSCHTQWRRTRARMTMRRPHLRCKIAAVNIHVCAVDNGEGEHTAAMVGRDSRELNNDHLSRDHGRCGSGRDRGCWLGCGL
ncbi:hypothetical protein SESBI_48535, partial [Sesbania bispinosa]